MTSPIHPDVELAAHTSLKPNPTNARTHTDKQNRTDCDQHRTLRLSRSDCDRRSQYDCGRPWPDGQLPSDWAWTACRWYAQSS